MIENKQPTKGLRFKVLSLISKSGSYEQGLKSIRVHSKDLTNLECIELETTNLHLEILRENGTSYYERNKFLFA